MGTSSTRGRGWARWLLLACVGCGKPASETSVAPVHAATAAPKRAPVQAPGPVGCETARCWLALAEATRGAGVDDAAAGYLGRAYAIDRDADTLRAWLGVLAGSGQARRLAATLDQTSAEHPAIVAERRAAASAPGVDGPVAPVEPSPEVRAALAAELEGRIDDAIAGLSGSREPVDLAHLGDLAWQRGDRAAARRAWSRARVEIDERGGRMRMAAVERWFTEAMAWSGDRLVLVREWRALDSEEPLQASELQHWAVTADRATLLRTVVLPGSIDAVAASYDGQRLLRVTGDELDVRELATGRSLARWPLHEDRVAALATAGTGPRALVLVAAEGGSQLRSADGRVLDTFELRGTTPTITRVYHAGQGTRHDNILQDAPTWPVSAAISSDGRWVAIGGSDSKVRLHDRERDRTRELAYDWSYEERRHQGGNPDLDLPLDLRFVDGGRALLVAYRHGDVIAWRTRDGRRLRALDGACSLPEAMRVATRYDAADVPPPSEIPLEQRKQCGFVASARFSHDAALVAAAGWNGVRVRDTATGRGLAMLVEARLPGDMLAYAPDGRLAFGNIYGRPWVWSPQLGTTTPWGRDEPPSGPIDPSLANDGRTLVFDLRQRAVVWDLEEGHDVSPVQHAGERVWALAPDGAWLVASGPAGVQLRRRDGTVDASVDLDGVTPAFLAGGKLLLASDQADARVRELDSGREITLAHLRGHQWHTESRDDERVVFFGHGDALRVFDTDRGELVFTADVDAHAAALAPDGTWVAWLELPDDEVAQAVACWRWLDDPEGRILRIPVPGWPKLLAPAPHGDELLAATESTLVRWRPREGTHRPVEGLGYVAANRIRYSADGRLLYFEGYDRIDVRENADDLPRLGTLHPLLDGGWLVVSEAGALDGSETAPQSMMTVVDGAGGDVLVHVGTLGWDRFAVEGLWAQLRAGRRVVPAIEPAPRPVLSAP